MSLRCCHLGLDRFVQISISFLLPLLLYFSISASCYQVVNALLLPGRANFLSCPGLKSYSKVHPLSISSHSVLVSPTGIILNSQLIGPAGVIGTH